MSDFYNTFLADSAYNNLSTREKIIKSNFFLKFILKYIKQTSFLKRKKHTRHFYIRSIYKNSSLLKKYFYLFIQNYPLYPNTRTDMDDLISL